jgi:hypothetical protein
MSKSKAGRPSKYNDEILTKAKDYIENYEKNYDDVIPSVAGLAVVLKVARDTIYDWAKQTEKSQFSDTLDELLAVQERVLFNKGLSGDFNSNIVKLALGNHGYSDKKETVVTDKRTAAALTDDELTRIATGSSEGTTLKESSAKEVH